MTSKKDVFTVSADFLQSETNFNYLVGKEHPNFLPYPQSIFEITISQRLEILPWRRIKAMDCPAWMPTNDKGFWHPLKRPRLIYTKQLLKWQYAELFLKTLSFHRIVHVDW